jgi:hypothetical protein
MISKKLKNCEEKKTFIERSLKIIFLAVFILLVSPSLVKAWCLPLCYKMNDTCSDFHGVGVNECNGGVTPGCCACGWKYNVNCNDVGYICKSDPCWIASIDAWTKCDKFPDTSDYNGRPCAVYSSGVLTCNTNGEGIWDASERKCIQCNGKVENKVCGSAGTVSTDTCNAGLTYCISTGCTVAGNGKCETACDASVSSKCDDKASGDPCGVGGTCNDDCQCIEPPPACSWQNDNCGSPCPWKKMHQTCGPAGCVGNCDGQPPGSTRCIYDLACDCEATCSCKCPVKDGEEICPCALGTCPPELRGGLVPCGKNCDDPCTKECECCPCTLCHLFVLFKRIVDFLTLNIIFPLAVLMIVVGGVMFLTAAGDPGRIGTAKKILTSVVIGLLIIFLAWLIVDTIISFLTTGSPFEALFKQWNTINCPIP